MVLQEIKKSNELARDGINKKYRIGPRNPNLFSSQSGSENEQTSKIVG